MSEQQENRMELMACLPIACLPIFHKPIVKVVGGLKMENQLNSSVLPELNFPTEKRIDHITIGNELTTLL